MIPYLENEKLAQGYYSETGTVLRRKDSVKGGQSLLIFLRGLGPRWVNAPSGKNRFGGATEPLVWGTFNLYQSPSMLYLQGAEVKEDFISLRNSRDSLLAALRIYKQTAKILMDTHTSDNILNLLWSTMVQLSTSSFVQAVEFRFIWRLLNLLGTAPSLQNCVCCGAVIDGTSFWTDDGLKCNKCLLKTAGNYSEINIADLQLLQKTALLGHDSYLVWSQKQTDNMVYLVHTKKLMTFFDNVR